MSKLTQEEINIASLVAGVFGAPFVGVGVWLLTHNLFLDLIAAFVAAPVIVIATKLFIYMEQQ